jgi:hypothetical protein
MRQIKQQTLHWFLGIATIILLLSGCQGEMKEKNNSISMQTGVAYTIQQGDQVIDNGDAQVQITHLVEANTKEVTLLSGSATLLYGSYEEK